MGNQLIKDTYIEKESIGMGGISSQWEMHSGHKLDKTKTPVTVYLFDKKVVGKMSASAREEYMTVIRKEAQTLARFKHPNIVSLIDPLLEDQKSLGFVSEAVKGSLNNFINANKASEIFPTEIDTKFNILELAETLSFLHNDVKSCHLGISPENVYVLANEKWKLGGFTFTTQVAQGGLVDAPVDFQKHGEKVTPSLKFTAPEVASFNPKCTFASDIFSLGCLIYTVYKINSDKNTNNPYLMNATTINGVQDFSKEITKQNFFCIPDPIRSTVIRMLHPDPNMRITIIDFLNHSWFKDPFIQTVKHLETLYQKEFPQQQSFLKGISQIITKFEKKFVMSKILPLLNNLIKNEQLSASILPAYFKLIDSEGNSFLTKEEFHNLIWPSLKSLSSGKQMPAQALYLLIQNSHLLVDIGDIKEIQTVFVPLLIKAFECNVQKLQVLALQKTESLFSKIEYNVSKSQILPRILSLCINNNIEVRKESLILLSKIYSVFDKAVINDHVLTTLEKVRKMSNNYKINMTILTIFEGISKNIGIDVVANKILISLIPMIVDPGLSKPEYKAYMSTVRAYLKRIEDELNLRYENMSDLPPEEATEESSDINKNQPKREDKPITGEFEFLNAINGGPAEVQTGGGTEFDFTGFEEQFTGLGKSQSGSSAPSSNVPDYNWSGQGSSGMAAANKQNQFDDHTFPVSNPKLSNPMTIKSQPKTFGQESQNLNPLTNPSVPNKSIKSLGNPFNNPGAQAQNQTPKQTQPGTYNFNTQNTQAKQGTSTTLTNQQQGSNMFNNMKVTKPTPNFPSGNMNQTGGQGKWDLLDSEIQLNDNNSNYLGSMVSNQTSSYGMGGYQGANTFQSGGGNNFQTPSTQTGLSGWDDMDLDLGAPTGGIGGMGNINTNSTFGSSTPNQGKFNQPAFNPPVNQNVGNFSQNTSNTSKPTFPGSQKTQTTNFQNKTNAGINNSDDFFSSFDIKEKPGVKKNPPFNFGQKSQTTSNDDLI